MANTKVWTMNETQKDFMATLKAIGRATTLMEINAVAGKEFKTGTINTLVTKGLVRTEDVEVAYVETKTFDFNGVAFEVKANKTMARKAYALNE